MKYQFGGVNIFNNQKFITKSVSEKIPPTMQVLMWEMIRQLPADIDYLQVFSLSEKDGEQVIIHSQEIPEYKRKYVLNVPEPITAKVFVIDSGTYSAMLFANEY